MTEPRRTFVPPRDPDAEMICLLDATMLDARAENPKDFFDAARSQETLPNGTLFRFEALPGAWERVERFIVDERECCPFFAFEQWEEDGAVVLSITKPEGAPG